MSETAFTIHDDFPTVDYDQWRAGVEAELAGAPFEKKLVSRTYEGIEFQPIYTLRDALEPPDAYGFPGMPPYVRGATPAGRATDGLEIRQEHAEPALADANRAILEDLTGGVGGLLLRLDRSARRGQDADQRDAADASVDGVLAYSLDDLDAVLADVHVDLISVCLDAGAAFLPASALLISLWQRRGAAADAVRGSFGADPLAALAREGALPYSLEDGLRQAADLARWTSQNLPRVTAFAIDTSPYHDAGATAAQDLAFGLAAGVQYLRALDEAGVDAASAARQFELRMCLGTHHFLAIAKLRAARRVWGRLLEACGCDASATVPAIHARASDRVLTRRDAPVNLLRNTVAMFAACVGGASAATSVPFDRLGGAPSALARRVARNTLFVLQDESHLNHVIDPAGGSWFFDRVTEQLAAEAWKIFQAVEREGGMAAALRSGWVNDQIQAAFEPRAQDLARRKESIIGVSEFPNIEEEGLPAPQIDTGKAAAEAAQRVGKARQAGAANLGSIDASQPLTPTLIEAAAAGATLGQMAAALGMQPGATTAARIIPQSFAEPFEHLRDASDAWRQKHGRRPRVFLANMGPIAHHTARATFSKNFFEAGGFEAVNNDGFETDAAAAAAAFAESGARIAVICSSDKLYPEVVPPTAGALKQAGARTVVLAGHPGDNEAAYRDAGVDRFIFIKCDVLATLQELLRDEGVL